MIPSTMKVSMYWQIVILALLIESPSLLNAQSLLMNESMQIEAFNKLLDNIVPFFVGQRKNNVPGPSIKHRNLLLKDTSNDDLATSEVQEIITAAGFEYENYHSVSNDGYITMLVRIVNPLVDKEKLKQPPVMFVHGGTIDMVAFVWASIRQHHPEPYPRLPKHGPFTSSNRSLAFTLANNGYDVWLAGTRGANRQNQGHVKWKYNETSEESQLLGMDDLSQKYWRYSFNELIDYELPRQIDKIMSITKSKKISMVGLSLGTITTLALYAGNKKYAKKVHAYVSLMPIINNRNANLVMRVAQRLLTFLPNSLGISLVTQFLFTKYSRSAMLSLAQSKKVRYTLVAFIVSLLQGASPTYQTFLELPVVGHVQMPLGFIEAKHYAQIVMAGRLQKYDHGPLKNLQVYGSSEPLVYDLSDITVKNWAVVSAGLDNLATPASVQQVLEQVNPKPVAHIHVPHFNHIDVHAAVENDKYINLPVLEFMNKFH